MVAGWAVSVSAAPQVVCTAPAFDFGTVENADDVTHSFVIENGGDETLTFGQVRACCGATAALRDTSVAPGTNTQFDVKLSLKGRQGAVSKNLYIATNDPRTPHVILKLTGRIEPSPGQSQVLGSAPETSQSGSSVAAAPTDLVVVPQALTLLLSDTPKPVTRYVALRSRSQSPFMVKGISLPMEAVVKSQTPFGKAGWRIEIGNLVPSGKLEGAQVTFITDLTNEPPISIPIHIAPQQDKGAPPP